MMTTQDQPLVQIQSSPYWNERREAALALKHSKEPEVKQALIKALDDHDDDVLQAVIVALGEVGDEEAAEHMVLPRYLNHPNPQIRWAVLKSIGKIGRSFIITEVARLIDDPEWVVRNEARRVLQKQVESLVTDFSTDSAQRMVSLLSTSNEELREILINAFIRIGHRIKPMLRDFARMGGKEIQTAMVYVLGQIKDQECVPLLIELLENPDKYIRKSAIEALGQIRDVTALTAMIERFGDASREVQISTIEAIAKIGKPALEQLHETLRYSSRKLIQQNVLHALAQIRNHSSIPYLIEYMGSTYFIVRRAAITGLVKYGDVVIDDVHQVIKNIKWPMVEDLLSIAENGPTVAIRVKAINALGAVTDHRAVHLLKKLAASEEKSIQKASLAALAQIGCSCWQRCGALAVLREMRKAPDVDLIVDQLDNDSENVRHRAVQVLARCGNPQAVPALLQTSTIDGNPTLRCESLRAADELAPADPEVVKTAKQAMSDPDPRVQAEAIRIMGRSPEPSNLSPLLECLKSPSWEVRRNAALALGNMGNIALPSLLDRLYKGDTKELESVIRAIGNVGSPEAMPAIEEILAKEPAESQVRNAAQKAIADIREKEEERQKG